jgi:hypothetical protein
MANSEWRIANGRMANGRIANGRMANNGEASLRVDERASEPVGEPPNREPAASLAAPFAIRPIRHSLFAIRYSVTCYVYRY